MALTCPIDFDRLARDVSNCRRCPRMAGRTRAFGPRNGSLSPVALFIAEAPGRLGAERTGVPLSGDESGRFFNRLLDQAGIDRTAVFVTNAVLCNPRDETGRNAAPSRSEQLNCLDHLQRTITVLDPPVVVSLGRTALRSLGRIKRHGLTLKADVAGVSRWADRWLVPLYHPGPRARVHRSVEQQCADFRALASFLLVIATDL